MSTSCVDGDEQKQQQQQQQQQTPPPPSVTDEIDAPQVIGNDDDDGDAVAIDDQFDNSMIRTCCDFPAGHTFLSITGDIIPQSANTSCQLVLLFLGQTIIFAATGHAFGADDIADIGVGISCLNVISLSVLVGFSATLDSVASIAYGRDPEGEEVAIWTQIAVCVNIVLCIPFNIMFEFSEPLISAVFGDYPQAAAFLGNSHVYVILFACNVCFSKSLQMQHRANIPMIASVIGTVVCVLCALLIIPNVSTAASGVAWSLTLSFASQLASNLVLSTEMASKWFDDERRGQAALFWKLPWCPPSRFLEVCTRERLCEYLTLGIAATASTMQEWVNFELLFVLAAHVSKHEVAAWAIIFQVLLCSWSCSGGLATAAASWVGKILGERGRPQVAFAYGRVCCVWAIICGITTFCIIASQALFDYDFIFRLYTKDENLLKTLRGLIPFLLVYTISDDLQFAIQGIYRGVSRPGQTVLPCFVGLFLVGLGCASVSVFLFHNGLRGMIIGWELGFVIEIPLLLYVMGQWDWRELAAEAVKHYEEEQQQHEVVVNNGGEGGLEMDETAADADNDNADNDDDDIVNEAYDTTACV